MSDAYPIKGLIKSAEKFHCIRNEDKYARYRSWEHCNKVFNEKHEKRKNGSELSEDEYDYLALHLSFYLASWGMYRGSTLLLYTDYKIHIPIVEELMKEKYDKLWNITYDNLNNEKDNISGLIVKIKEELYGNRVEEVKKLSIKSPEFIQMENEKHKLETELDSIRQEEALAKFYEDNEDELNKLLREFEKDGVRYPQMKILDMMFFQYGMDNF